MKKQDINRIIEALDSAEYEVNEERLQFGLGDHVSRITDIGIEYTGPSCYG